MKKFIIRLISIALFSFSFIWQSGKAQSIVFNDWAVNGVVKTSAQKGDTLMFGGVFGRVGKATGGLARVSKIGGEVDLNFPKVVGSVSVIVADGNGGWYIGGLFSRVGTVRCYNIAHILSDFTVEDWTPLVDNWVKTIHIRENTLLIGGEFRFINGENRNFLAEISKTSQGDATTFDLQIPYIANVAGGNVQNIEQYGSKIYISMHRSFTLAGFGIRYGLFSLNASDLSITSWTPIITSNTNGLRVYSINFYENTVIATGHFMVGTQSNIAQFDTINGNIGTLTASIPSNSALLVASMFNNKLYLTGGFGSTNSACFNIVSNSFESWAPTLNGTSASIIDDKLITASTDILKVDLSNGSIDNSSCTTKFDQIGFNCIVDNGDHYIVGGSFKLANTILTPSFVAFNTIDNSVLSLRVQPSSGNGVFSYGAIGINSMAVDGNTLYIGGTFGTISTNISSSQNRYCAATVNLSTGALGTWNPVLSGSAGCSTPFVSQVYVSKESVYLCGNFTGSAGISAYNYWRAYNKTTGSIKSAFAPTVTSDYYEYCSSKHPVYGMKIIPQGLLVWGTFKTISGQKKNGIALIDSITGVAKPMNLYLDTMAIVSSVLFNNDKLIVAGKFGKVKHMVVGNIAIIDTAHWSLYPTYIKTDSTIEKLTLFDSKLYMFGKYTEVNGQPYDGISAFDLKTNSIVNWNPNFPNQNTIENEINLSEYFTSIIHNNKLYLAGSFSYLGYLIMPNLIKWELFPSNTIKVTGRVYNEGDANCVLDANESGIGRVLIKATPGDYFSSTNNNGDYNLVLPIGSYTISQIFLGRDKDLITSVCANTHNITGAYPLQEIKNINFGNTIEYCYYLDVDVVSEARRRCAKTLSTITYYNSGNQVAENLTLKIAPSHYIKPLSSTPVWNNYQNDTLYYSIPSVPPRTKGVITLVDSNHCVSIARGTSQCIKAIITPGSECMPSSIISDSWDKSSIKVSGRCIGDSVEFIIVNSGSGDMNTPSEYRVYFDQTLGYTGSFQLESEEKLIVMVNAMGKTVRLEADQHPLHPGRSRPRTTVEDCGTINSIGVAGFRVGLPLQVPFDDANPEIEEFCAVVIDSYDPNDKQAIPSGTGIDKVVVPGQKIKYTIRFQNTGTAEAIHVRIIDTLDEGFDPELINFKSMSHSGTVEIKGEEVPILEWNFPNINLLPAQQDSLASQGFVSFEVGPREGLPLSTEVFNEAGIYFDYNEPIITNMVALKYDLWDEEDETLGAQVVFRSEIIAAINSKYIIRGNVVVFPNPSTQQIFVTGISDEIIDLQVNSMQGNSFVLPYKKNLNSLEVDIHELQLGCYSITVKTVQQTYNLVFIKSE